MPTGSQFFKLDQIAPLNGFAHEHAHDATADVEATIFLCRLVMERAPDLWSSFMRFSQKAAVVDHVLADAIFCLSDFYFGSPYSWIVGVIGSNSENPSEFYVYNLAIEPKLLAALDEDELTDRLDIAPKPVRMLRSNACPIIVPIENAPAIAGVAELGIEELIRRADFLRESEEFRNRLVTRFEAVREQPEASPHLEHQIYDGFFPKQDETLIDRFHVAPWEERPSIVRAFQDQRLRKIGQRLIYLERPDLLSGEDRLKYERAVALRISRNEADVPWLTLPQALADLDDLISNADAAEVAFLQEHRAHLVDRIAKAALIVNGFAR
jgi:exodeoxyribonuclease-1